MPDEKKLFLLDAYALIFRAYYAFIKNPMYNAEGLNTSCIFGFVNTLEEVLSKEKPSYIAVAFDPGGPNFRHEMYSEYKANRDETPEDIKKSVPFIKQILNAYGIPILQMDGFEADDIIGTIAKQAERDGYTVYMMTPDKDYIQLLSDHIFMYKPNRSGGIDVVTREKACSVFRLSYPEQFIDILALMGDASDNIPGAPGVGEKTAMKLLEEYVTLDNLKANTDKLKGKLQENIVNNWDKVLLSRALATIKTDVPINVSEEELILSKPDLDKIRELFNYLNFKALEKRVLTRISPAPQLIQTSLFDFTATTTVDSTPKFKTIADIAHEYILADTKEIQQDLLKLLSAQTEFCFDTETTSLDVISAQLVGMSFSWKIGQAYYVPVSADKVEAQSLVDFFKPAFENPSILKVGQNLKYDISVLKNYGVYVQGPFFDTMLAHYLIQPEGRHNMDTLSEQYLGYAPVHIEELIGVKGKHQISMRSVPISKIKDYAAEDADVTWQLKNAFEPELQKLGLSSLAEKVEMPLVPVLSDMETTGVTLDIPALKDFAGDLRTDIIELEQRIFSLAGMEFNIASPKQLGDVLFEKLKIDSSAKKTKTQQYSTNEEVLAQLADKHEIIPVILEYRGLRKLLSTYVEALPQIINPISGKVHTSYNQALTATGRLSSTDPNLQNIPIREERGREIRKAFVPSTPEFVILSADYSQIELRIMAHMSKDESMLEAFRQNEDIHTSTAAKIFGVSSEDVSREMRRKAKTANFGIIYGISAFGLSQRLTIPRKEAAELIDGYFKTFPGVKTYMDSCIKTAREKGHVETILGRRRHLADINSANSTVRGVAERNAINSPIQGSAADIIKLAMIDIYSEFNRLNLRTKMILQVHDELVFDVFKPELETVKEIVKTKMESAIQLDIPLIVEVGVGNNWLEAH